MKELKPSVSVAEAVIPGCGLITTEAIRLQEAIYSQIFQLLGNSKTWPCDGFSTKDVALINLACANGLPGAHTLNIPECLKTLENWTQGVQRFTAGAMEEFRARPEAYDGSEAAFRFLAMVTFLKHPRGIGIKYQPTAIDNFNFRDSRDDLLHGLLTRRLGTCTSLPVLFVAIGRRLGYPMHLAIAKSHVLCQWVNPDGSHLNLEGSTAGGGEIHPDERYHRLPRPLTTCDLSSGRFLRPLDRGEEFGLFLETRGHCLADNGRFEEAREAYAAAHQVSNGWSQLQANVASLDMMTRATHL